MSSEVSSTTITLCLGGACVALFIAGLLLVVQCNAYKKELAEDKAFINSLRSEQVRLSNIVTDREKEIVALKETQIKQQLATQEAVNANPSWSNDCVPSDIQQCLRGE